jgi:hypothetical protein
MFRTHLLSIRGTGVRAKTIYNLDLFNYLKQIEKVDVMFMDFAWPWRSGQATDEYDTTANKMSLLFNDKECHIKIWDKNDVLKNVLKAVRLAQLKAKYVLLSNQSSNFPDPDTLEIFLLTNNITFERHTMTAKALKEDNLNNEKWFREYVYVIKGV